MLRPRQPSHASMARVDASAPLRRGPWPASRIGRGVTAPPARAVGADGPRRAGATGARTEEEIGGGWASAHRDRRQSRPERLRLARRRLGRRAPRRAGWSACSTPLARRASVAWFCCVSEPPDAEQAREGLYTTAADRDRPAAARRARAAAGATLSRLLRPDQQRGAVDAPAPPHRRRRLRLPRHAPAPRLGAAIWRPTRGWPSAVAARAPAPRRLPGPGLPPLSAAGVAARALPEHAHPALHAHPVPRSACCCRLHAAAPGARRSCAGLLGADVVGLQTPRDVRAFLACCARIPRRDGRHRACDGAYRRWPARSAVRAYPASVDPRRAAATMRPRAVAASRAARLAPRPGQQTIIRVDRLDPSKNQHVGFLAFGRLLEMRPDLRGRVALPGVPGAVAHRPGHLSRVSRRRLRARSSRSTQRFTPDRAASHRSRSSTPTTASRRWRRCSAATCCWSTRCTTG